MKLLVGFRRIQIEEVGMCIENVVLRAMGNKCTKKGDSFRMKHEFKMNGSVCTESHKDPALVITRDTSGWVWHCHRCHESGFIGDRYVDPESTVNKVKQITETEELPQATYIVKLPDDFVPLVEKVSEGGYYVPEVPFEAHDWLWQYNINEKEMLKFGFGWSNKYKMVILPLYSDDGQTFEGWLGRRVLDKMKNKYHIQKSKGNPNRLYFTIKGSGSSVILVEDCLSAIRVNDSLNVTTIALLTTSIDETLINKLRGKEVYVWLDADALSNSVAMVSRLRQLGIQTKHIHTTKDPKCYNNVAIKEIIK